MHFSSDAIAELEGLTYGKSKNLQAAGAGKGIRQRCRRIVRYCPNALFAASTRHTHGVKACYLIMRPDPCTRLSRVKRHAPRTSAARLYGIPSYSPGNPLSQLARLKLMPSGMHADEAASAPLPGSGSSVQALSPAAARWDDLSPSIRPLLPSPPGFPCHCTAAWKNRRRRSAPAGLPHCRAKQRNRYSCRYTFNPHRCRRMPGECPISGTHSR